MEVGKGIMGSQCARRVFTSLKNNGELSEALFEEKILVDVNGSHWWEESGHQ